MGLIFFLGYAIGSIVVFVLMKLGNSKRDGTLNIVVDHTDPESKPYLYLELDHPINKVTDMHSVTLHVKNKDYNPR